MTPDPHQETTQERIEHTLRALGSAEPSGGMDARILNALAQRRAEEGAGGTAVSLMRSWRVPFTALASALLLTVLITGHLHHAPRNISNPQRNDTHLATQHAVIQLQNTGSHTSAHTTPEAATSRRSQAAPSLRNSHLAPGQGAQMSASSNPGRITTASTLGSAEIARLALDRAALDDTLAPSQPAPPLPPTAQEQLVGRLLRRNQGTEIAKLAAARDPELAAAEREQLHAFFEPRPAPKDDGQAGPSAPSPSSPSPESTPPPHL